jgi:integron integrase
MNQPDSKRLLDVVRETLRRKHYSLRTEQAYLSWIRRFIRFHHFRHPRSMSKPEIEAFLTYLAVRKKVSSSTQNQALSALLFLYRIVLDQPIDFPLQSVRAKRPKRLPTVLSREEVIQVIPFVTGASHLVVQLLYGSGLRLSEGIRLRIKDLDFGLRQIIGRDGKGHKDRITILPGSLRDPLKRHLVLVRQIHRRDLDNGYGCAFLPYALARKYSNAERECIWQYVFPSPCLSIDP